VPATDNAPTSAIANRRDRAAEDLATEDDHVRTVDDRRTRARVVGVAHQIGRGAVRHTRPAQPLARGPARRAQRLGRAHADALERVDLVADPAVGDHAARVGAREDRDTRLARRTEPGPAGRVEISHVFGVGRVFRCAVGDSGKILDVDQRRNQGGAMLDHQIDGVVGQPGAMFDAVDSRLDQPRQCVLTEHVRRHPRTDAVCRVDRRLQDVVGPQRGQVTDLAVDPVTDQLDPAVAAPRLFDHRIGQLRFVLQLDCEVALIALRPGEETAVADDARQVVALVEGPGVDRRPAVTQQQGADAAFDFALRRAVLETVERPVIAEPDVAVRVDQPGHNPAVGPVSAEYGHRSFNRLGAQNAVDDPPLHRPFVGKSPTAQVQSHQFLGNFSFDRSMSARPGGNSSSPLGISDRSGKPAGNPGIPAASGLRTFGGVGPLPPFFLPACLFLPLPVLRLDPLRPNGIPIWPAICDIILRASKNRSTS
jgi:hypothetical protein